MTSSLFIFQIANISSIYLFQASGFLALHSRICDSTFPIKILAKATAILVPMAFHAFGGSFFPVNWNEFSCRISSSALLRYCVGMGDPPS